MLQAEECIIEHPDSALAYLSSLEKEIKGEPKETQMYYYLLTIKAKDKLYIYHTSDSLIKVITQFYEDYGNNDKLMEAYYYMGSVYRDMNDAPRALKAFQDAIDVGKDSKRYDLLAQTYGQMATLFAYQGLYDESLKFSKHALDLYSCLKDQVKTAITIRNIARIYYAQEKQDSALYYYREAYEYVSKTNDQQIANSLLSELGCVYSDIGKIDSAKRMLQKAIKEKFDIENAILNLGILYKRTGELDSAQHYLNQIVKSTDIYKQRHAYIHLSQIEAEKKNYQIALEYAYQFIKLRDSINNITQTEAISKIQALYNYQHTEKENNELKLANENKRVQVYRLLFVIMMLITISLFSIVYIKKKKQRVIEKERELRRIKEEQYAQSIERIENNKKEITKLEMLLHKAEENDFVNKRIIQSQKEQLEHINHQVIAIRKEQSLLESTFEQSQIYLLFHKAGKNANIKITENEWTELQMAIDKTYHDFTNRLYALYPQLSLLELRICYLIKISMQVKEIAKLVNRSKPAISIARTRLYKKFHGTEGTVEMLDRFIINL